MLDLKYRPLTFESMLGNHSVISLLRNRSIHKRLSNRSLMFGGPKGCGKTTLARICARSSVCLAPVNGDPCNECDPCLSHLRDSNAAIIEIDAATSGTVERIRTIVDELDYGSIGGEKTVLILDEAHRLSASSQDALLKSMEDRRVFAILCTTEPHKIRAALRDRVDEFAIRPPTVTEMYEHLKTVCSQESILFTDSALHQVIRHNQNMPRSILNAVGLLSESGGVTDDNVANLFRYDSVRSLNTVFLSFPDASSSYEKWDYVGARESAGWIRDRILDMVSDSIRQMVGVNKKHDYDLSFVNAENFNALRSMAVDLAKLDKPNIYDIETIIFGYGLSLSPIPTVLPPVSMVPIQDTLPPKATELSIERIIKTDRSVPVVKPPNRKLVVEIDGVSFSSDEKLTSLHDKITPSRGPSIVTEDTETAIQYDEFRVPMSEQEFSRVFYERTKT